MEKRKFFLLSGIEPMFLRHQSQSPVAISLKL
jgi:hypothetical protein